MMININTKQINKKRVSGLDGLRAFAVILILLYHLFPNLFKGGFVGVSLFFALSGYLVAWTSFKASAEGRYSVKEYYWKRVKRIYPALFLVVFFSAGIYWLMNPMILDGRKKEILSIFLGLDNYFQISQNADYFTKAVSASPFTHLWAIAIEMQFYLAWPILLSVFKRWKKISPKQSNYLWLGLILVSVIVIQFTYRPGQIMLAYYGTISRMSSIFLGVSLASFQWNSSYQDRFPLPGKYYALVLLILSVLMIFWMNGQSPWTYRIGLLMSSIVSVEWIRLCSNNASGIGKKLEIPILKWLNRFSYEIYLWQYPVLFVFQYYHLDQWPLMWILIAACIIGLANYSHDFLEQIHFVLIGGKKVKS